MDKLKMHTPNLADENFKKLSAMFPNAVTETINENGEIVRAIDADVLRQEISASVVEGKQERYQFTWPDKKKSVVLANQPINKTLRLVREKSVGRDGTLGSIDTENIYIEGDNLDALKLLQETYLGKVKLIYIDPPYNTGNDFIYEDDFSQSTEEYLDNSGQSDKEGNRLVANLESNGRFHTDWLNMLYPRLRIAKDLLTDDGVIFISIDDHESANLQKMCTEIFGQKSFVANISWQRTYSTRNDSHGIVNEVEHIIVFSKKENWSPIKLARTSDMNSIYKSPDNDPRPWTSSSVTAPGAVTHQGMVYAIQHPFTGEMMYPTSGRCWTLGQSQMLENLKKWCAYELKDIYDAAKRATVCGIEESEVRKDVKAIVLSDTLEKSRMQAQKVMDQGKWPYFYFTNGGKGGIRRKTYLDEMGGRLPTNFWSFEETGHTDEAKKELKVLFDGQIPFDTPKPTRLIDRILDITADDDSIVMDFFSGSATTAHSVIKYNCNKKSHLKFVLIQIPDLIRSPEYSSLCDVGEDRIRRVGKKIRDDSTLFFNGLDTGFRVFKVDSSNMKDVYYKPADYDQGQIDLFAENIKEDRIPEDLLFQVMLDLGVLPSSKIEEKTIDGKKVFSVADGYLIACFDKEVTEDIVKAIAQKQPYYAVFQNGGIASDSVATNFEQIFETYSPQTQRRIL